jgi:hypothetical protein
VATHAAFFAKMFFWIFFVMWIRWTLPRFRYDQLMALGWKVLLPMALGYVMVTATAIWLLDQFLPTASPLQRSGVLFGMNLVIAVVLFWGFDRGRVVRGTGPRVTTRVRMEA